MPVVIVAGEQDRLVDIDSQSARLHCDVPQSRFHRVSGSGHMIHQTATGVVMSAINEVAEDSSTTDENSTRPSFGQSATQADELAVPAAARVI